jgi:hypothetical protein
MLDPDPYIMNTGKYVLYYPQQRRLRICIRVNLDRIRIQHGLGETSDKEDSDPVPHKKLRNNIKIGYSKQFKASLSESTVPARLNLEVGNDDTVYPQYQKY